MITNHEKSFSAHLWEAAKLNLSRLWFYAKASRGKSLPLSLVLVFCELSGLFYAWLIDRKARTFQAKGVPIIQADLVRISPSHDASHRAPYSHQASLTILREAELVVQAYRKQSETCLKQASFEALASYSYQALKKLEKLEEDGQCHFLMSRHLIESIGLGALHSAGYAKGNDCELQELSQRFLSFQVLPLNWSIRVDRLAQQSHACGVGILYNELPPIPFEQEWLERQSKEKS